MELSSLIKFFLKIQVTILWYAMSLQKDTKRLALYIASFIHRTKVMYLCPKNPQHQFQDALENNFLHYNIIVKGGWGMMV